MIVLADEINRASPRTQSALLEVMAEGQVSVDGRVEKLDDLFFVLATQNPVESHGTYSLPEAQMDRFALQFSLGYVSPEDEAFILSDQRKNHPTDTLSSCFSYKELLLLKKQVHEIRMSEELERYCVNISAATRTAPGVQLGSSPRGSLALMKISKALALFDGYEYVTPEHIQEITVPVIAHRLVMEPQVRFAGATAQHVVEEIVKIITVPA